MPSLAQSVIACALTGAALVTLLSNIYAGWRPINFKTPMIMMVPASIPVALLYANVPPTAGTLSGVLTVTGVHSFLYAFHFSTHRRPLEPNVYTAVWCAFAGGMMFLFAAAPLLFVNPPVAAVQATAAVLMFAYTWRLSADWPCPACGTPARLHPVADDELATVTRDMDKLVRRYTGLTGPIVITHHPYAADFHHRHHEGPR